MNDTSQPPVVVQPPSPYPPAPRAPRNSFPAWSAVVGVVGEELAQPLLVVEQAYAEAADAVAAVEANRPGPMGSSWRVAVTEDVEAFGSPDRPKKWRTTLLLEGDAQRWGTARASVGHAQAVASRCKRELDLVEISSVADRVAKGKASEWAEAAASGWQSRSDHAVAWTHRRHGQRLLVEHGAAMRVANWARGQQWAPDREDQPVPHVQHLPELPVSRGEWLALELTLEPATWLSLPAGVTWPPHTEELLDAALPSGARFLTLRGAGYREVDK